MKFGSFLRAVAPVRFRDAEVLQHHLAAHEPRRNRQRGHAMRPQLLRHRIRESADVDLDEIEEERLAIAERIAVADFDDQAATLAIISGAA